MRHLAEHQELNLEGYSDSKMCDVYFGRYQF